MAKVALSYGHGANTYEDKRSKFVVVNGKVYEEHTHNAEVGVRVKKILERHGVQVLVVQPPYGADVPLATRTTAANNWKADIYWSIHGNAAGASARGWCAFYWGPSGGNGKKLAELYAKHVKTLGLPMYSDDGIYPSQPGTWSDFHELRETNMPAVITENGFMTNPEDFKYIFLNKDGHYDKLAVAHAKAILEYFGIAYKAEVAPTPPPVQPAPSLIRVRKTWADAKSQIGAFGALENAKACVDANPGYAAFDEKGTQLYPAPKPVTPPAEHLYRVRKSWADDKSQLGAFKSLDSAKELADKNPGYKVYDETGKEVYAPAIVKPAEPTPTPTPPPVPVTPPPAPVDEHKGHHPIAGDSAADFRRLVEFVKKENPSAQDLEEIAKAFLEVGAKYGLRGDVAFAQSIIETGWFKFDGGTAVTPDQHNYAGIGVTSKGMKGNSFPTVKDGVTAQIQHLFAYATKEELPAGETLLDPRFKYVTRGVAPHWEDLNNKWAMNNNYGQHILSVYDNMMKFVVPELPPVVEEPKPEVPPVYETELGKISKILQAILDILKSIFGGKK
jgi:N-acetylmuramoyl-L-alanine amidase